MPVRSAIVGCVSEPHVCEVSTRRLLAYAAGLGETDACYFDDAAVPGIVAHPAFCVTLEWPVALAMRAHPLCALPRQEAIRAVHAAQDSIWHRPIRPGDRLRTTGTLIQVRAMKPGAFVVTRFETVDAATQAPVVTSYSSTIYRGVAVDGADAQIEEVPGLTLPSHDASTAQQIAIHVSRQAPHVYTECANIWNPIHTERRVALEAGLPDIILHGTATWALAASQLVHRCAGGDPTRLWRLSGRFTAMVMPGTTMTLRYHAGVDAAQTVAYTVCNDAGALAISRGIAVFTTTP